MSSTSLLRTGMPESILCKCSRVLHRHFPTLKSSPFSSHLHGHKFQIVARSEDYTSSNTTLNPPIVEGQANPIRRDTVQIPSMHSATLRIVADNPGTWFMHCTFRVFPSIPPRVYSLYHLSSRSHRVAFRVRTGDATHRSSSPRPTAQQRPASDVRPLQSTKQTLFRQRSWACIAYRPHWTPTRSVPPEIGLEAERHCCDDRVSGQSFLTSCVVPGTDELGFPVGVC